MRDRIAGDPRAQGDPIEYWGTRIGRALGLAITVGLMVWLVVLVLR